MRILVLQHIACEPPGVFEDVLVERGHELVRVELDEGEPLPARSLGRDRRDGRADERERRGRASVARRREGAIAIHVRAGRPFWGSCLGAQLLAAALGARVYAGPAPEVGVLAIELTGAGKADPVTGALPASIDTLQWHGDTFDLPEGGVLLASSPAYAHQAYRVGPVAYAVQFHVEVTEAMGEEWATVPAYAEYADRVLGPGGSDRLLVEFRAGSPRMQLHARAMFERWCDLAEAVGRSRWSRRPVRLTLVRVQRGVQALPPGAGARQRLDGAALRVAAEEHAADARELARAGTVPSGRRTLVPAVR